MGIKPRAIRLIWDIGSLRGLTHPSRHLHFGSSRKGKWSYNRGTYEGCAHKYSILGNSLTVISGANLLISPREKKMREPEDSDHTGETEIFELIIGK